MRRRIPRLSLLAIGALIAIVFSGCGGKLPPVVTMPEPSPAEVAAVRQIAGRIADGVSVALQMVDDTGRLIDALPLSAPVKDKYDCSVLKLVGVDSPSATVTATCGKLPTLAEAPLTQARTRLQAIASCWSLRSTTMVVIGAVEPFIVQLALSENPSLAFAANSLRAAFAYARIWMEGGGQCSPAS